MSVPVTGLSAGVTVMNELGLHARSAAKIAETAKSAAGSVKIAKGGEKVDAKDMLSLLTLACEKGTRLTIEIQDKADRDILEALAALFKSGFGESTNNA